MAEAAKPKRAKKAEAPVATIVARVRNLLDYHADTGVFRWRYARRGVVVGSIAGHSHNKGYIGIRIDGVAYLAHRLAWLWSHGRWPTEMIDHIDGDRKNNALSNLRECSNAQNCQNVKSHRDATSCHVGVCFVAKRKVNPWVAQICVNGKQHFVGGFPTERDAATARASAKSKFHQFDQQGAL